MADVDINKFRASVVRDGSKPASPGFIVSEGQDPVDPAGTGQNHLPVTIAAAATGLSITESQVLGGAGTTLQYLRGDASLATLPDLTGYVPYTGANQTVNLNTQQLQAGHTTLTTNGSTETLTIAHTSGSGVGVNITKAGNNEGLRVNKTSGSGNAATIIGTLEATTIVKTGGTSAQFLKADGTVDSTTYVPTSRTLTINGTTQDLSANRTFTIATHDAVTLGTANGLSLSGQVLSLGLASAGVTGALSGTDWTTFNNKQNALTNPVTGTGTTNFLPKFTGSTTIGNSVLQELSSNIGFGQSPLFPLDLLTSSAGTFNTIVQFFNNNFTAGNRSFLRVRQQINAGASSSSYFGTGQDGNLYIIANNEARGGDLVINFLTGNVLIGTTTDNGARLQVSGNQTLSGTIFANTQLNNTVISTTDATNITNGFNLLGSQSYWGIRTTTAGNFALDVYGSGSTKNALTILQSTGAATFSSSVMATQFITGGTPSNTAGFNNSFYAEGNIPSLTLSNTGVNTGKFTIGVTNGNLGIWNNATSTYNLFISSGNVGIGTTSPTNFASSYRTLAVNGSSASVLEFKIGDTSSAYLISDGTSSSFTDLGNRFFTIGTNSTERLRITSSGNVLFGTTTDAGQRLQVSGTGLITGETTIGNATAATNVNFNINGVTNKAGRILFMESGGIKWLIGNGAASENGRFEIYDNTNGTGVQLLRGATSWTALSDERFKNIIEPISVNNKLKNIRAVIGKYKTDKEGIRRNFLIAQDLLKVFPEVVDIDKDNQKPMGVRYQDLIPILVSAIQELKQEIDTLKN